MKTKLHSTFGLLHSAVALPLVFAAALLVSTAPATAATVAYWRFEAGPADTAVIHATNAGVFASDIPDSSGNSNALSVWDGAGAGYTYRTNRPLTVIPATGATNNFSVQNTGQWPGMFTRTGTAMQTMTPAAFTIEASFMPLATNTWRTLVGRDSYGTYSGDSNKAALYFQITPSNAVAIKFCDVSGVWHEAVSTNGIVTGFPSGNPAAGHWYHLAAVSDGTNLSLHLNPGDGFRLVAQTNMTASGSTNTALTAGLGGGTDWTNGTWSVCRGLDAGIHNNRAYGFIDEVRISDTALLPEQLLFRRSTTNKVTSTADSGPGTLREALASAINGDIVDATSVTGTITLTNGQLNVPTSVNILGPGPGVLTVSGNNASRVFNVTGTHVTISGLTIANGWGTNYGSGIKTYGAGSSVTINNCVVSNNSTTLDGGGIFNSSGVTMTLSNCTISGNSANGNGGGIYNSNATLTVIASTVTGNSARLVGGGIMNYGESGSAMLTINASTFSGNSADYGGGGIVNYGQSGNATLNINASTFSGNSAASGFGGTLYNNGYLGSGTLEIGDTILNAGTTGANIYNYSGTVTSRGYNLSSDSGGGFLTATNDRINTDPLLGPLQDNGGPTWTHALLPGSPAIDQGKRDAVTNLTSNADQRGFVRPVDLAVIPNAVGGDGSDIGAFESKYLFVTSTADSGPGTLRQALASAVNGDIVDATGVTGTITLTNGQLAVSNSVAILGPGPGALTVTAINNNRVFSATGNNVTIDGLTIANAHGADYGMGILTGSGIRLALNNCIVTSNSTTLKGGGIFISEGTTLTVSNCIVSGNSADGGGGGICNYLGVLTVVHSTFSGNSANYDGGGICNCGGLTVIASTFSGNSADGGGGIYNDGLYGATLTINASTFSGNSADYGGGIYNNGYSGSATLTINASTFSGNSADYGGGINNDGDYYGYATLTINASTFSSNSANHGGGIRNSGVPYYTTLEIGDTILNAGTTGANIYCGGTVTSHGYNLSSDSGGGFLTATNDWINTDPMLGTLQDNGGPTWTHALVPGSPAIDQGKRDAVTNLTSNADQRRFVRPVDLAVIPNAVGGDGSDIGAYEQQRYEGTDIQLNADDSLGTSSFNSALNWSDGLPPSAGKNYFNADFLLRTPADGNSHVFGGDSLTITSDAALGSQPNDALMFKGTASSTITVSNLIINGGFLRHANNEAQTFTLAGNLTVGPGGMAVAVQGPLNLTAAVLGSGPIKIMASGNTDVARTVEFDSASNTYNGSIELVNATQSRFRLATNAVMNFLIGPGGVNNRIFATPGTGGGVVTLNGTFKFDLTGASTNINDTWQIVDSAATLTRTYGATFAANGFWHFPDNTWSKAANGTIYVYNPSNGTLTVTGFRPGYDTDADGLPDDWELACFGNLGQHATDDFDGDGQNNLFEFLADTSPIDANDFLHITSFTRDGTYNTLWWTSKSTRLYQVERREALNASSPWETIITNAVPGWNNVGFHNTGLQYFYRIRAVQP